MVAGGFHNMYINSAILIRRMYNLMVVIILLFVIMRVVICVFLLWKKICGMGKLCMTNCSIIR